MDIMTDSSMSTTSSNDLNSHHGIHKTKRLRTVKLSRPHTGTNHANLTIGHPLVSSFGFSIRGGREFGTGFFISNVFKGSEADVKGLKVGDQIIRVGNSTGSYRVDDAVHRELSQFIANQNRLVVKVRDVGILPVKERATDPLTWHVVPSPSSLAYAVQDSCERVSRDVQIVLNVAPRAKLGCGICKGPDWKPGIFVQFTKDNGIAKEAGLQPGDQIASCNGVDFGDILFSEAVSVMKASSVLELIIRPGAGLDLFPSESSGYNSSASSVTGDQSPCWGEHSKRLSIVREESTNSNDRLNGMFKIKSYRKDPVQVEVPRVPSNYPKGPSNNNILNDSNKCSQNTTIIKLTENGPTLINNTIIQGTSDDTKDLSGGNMETTETFDSSTGSTVKLDPSKKIADICFVSRQNETKIITVEVHESTQNENQLQSVSEKVDGEIILRDEQLESCSSSLSSAISDELKRRAEKKLRDQNQQNNNSMPSDIASLLLEESIPQKKMQSSTSPTSTNNIHEILMDEFKKAHKKMFKNGFVENEYQQQQQTSDNGRLSLLEMSTLKCDNKEECQLENKNNGTPRIISNVRENKKPAPLPPPKKIDKQLSSPNVKFAEMKEPCTPKPDYDFPDGIVAKCKNNQIDYKSPTLTPPPPPPPQKGTMSRIAFHELAKAKGDVAEMESLESFKLTSPSSKIPVPPPMYFQASHKFEPATLRKVQQKPVSVIVSSYDMSKKDPGKLGFVYNNNIPDRRLDENVNVDMSRELKHELEKTLSRSNLRRSLDNILKPSSDPAFDATNEKQIVHISKKHEPSALNGILKNRTSKENGNGTVKNISFNDMPK